MKDRRDQLGYLSKPRAHPDSTFPELPPTQFYMTRQWDGLCSASHPKYADTTPTAAQMLWQHNAKHADKLEENYHQTSVSIGERLGPFSGAG